VRFLLTAILSGVLVVVGAGSVHAQKLVKFASLCADSIGDLTAVTDRFLLVIERDQAQGAAAQFKKIFLVDLAQVDATGFLIKFPVADLLQLADPLNLGRQGPLFRFSFQTIESVIPMGDSELGILDDNNYPFSNGRNPGVSDPNEFIVIRLPQPIVSYAGAGPSAPITRQR
jgi:hypothetical protein